MKKNIFIFYSFSLGALSIYSYLFVDANLFYFKNLFTGFFLQQRILTSVIFVMFLIVMFGWYLYFVSLKKVEQNHVKKLIFLTVACLFFSYPAMLSFDMFNYLATAKVSFLYKENPYIMMPIEFMYEPLLNFMHAPNKVALYGPFWILLTLIPFIIGSGNFLVTLFSFKLFVIILYLATLVVLLKISRKKEPVVLFGLHPLVVIETLVSGHNDIVMMFFALLAFFFFQKKNILLSFISLLLSILIKYATVFLLPLFIYALWKKEKINWNTIYYYATLSMLLVFFITPLREEMYPWYGIWFLSFVCLISHKKWLFLFCQSLSFGLLLRYVPFMYSGTYFGSTPLIRTIVTVIPVLAMLGLIFKKSNIWGKRFFQ